MSAAIVGESGHTAGPDIPEVASVLADLLAAGGGAAPQRAYASLSRGALALLRASAVVVLVAGEGDSLRASAAAGAPLTEGLLEQVTTGPCHELRTGGSTEAVCIPDLRRDVRWPALCSQALACGLRSLTVAPLTADPEGFLGAIVVGHDRPGGLSEAQLELFDVLTAAAGNFERMHRRLAQAWSVAGQLEGALSTRVAVEQAKGFLAGRLRISPGDAFHLLRGYARPRNLKMSHVARRLLDGSLDPAELLRGGQAPATDGTDEGTDEGPVSGACA